MVKRIASKLAIPLVVLLSLLVALSSFFISDFGSSEKKKVEPGVFLSKNKLLEARLYIDDSSHFLGEKFDLVYYVQYKKNKIHVRSNSVLNASFAPFEILGDLSVKHQDLNKRVGEYQIIIRLAAFNAVPGNSYTLALVELEYTRNGSRKIHTVNITPNKKFQISSYYSGDLEGVALRPEKGKFKETWKIREIIGFAGIGLTFLAMLLLVFKKNRKDNSMYMPDSNIIGKTEYEILFQNFKLFYENKWLNKRDTRQIILGLEDIAKRYWINIKHLSAEEFWSHGDNLRRNELLDIFKLSYKEYTPSYKACLRGIDLVNELVFYSRQPKRTKGGKNAN